MVDGWSEIVAGSQLLLYSGGERVRRRRGEAGRMQCPARSRLLPSCESCHLLTAMLATVMAAVLTPVFDARLDARPGSPRRSDSCNPAMHVGRRLRRVKGPIRLRGAARRLPRGTPGSWWLRRPHRVAAECMPIRMRARRPIRKTAHVRAATRVSRAARCAQRQTETWARGSGCCE